MKKSRLRLETVQPLHHCEEKKEKNKPTKLEYQPVHVRINLQFMVFVHVEAFVHAKAVQVSEVGDLANA